MLAAPMAVIMLITVLLVTVLSAGSIRSWRQGQDALGRMEWFRQLLVLQEVLGLEREATNGATSTRSAVPPELGAALEARRQATDRRLSELAALPGLSDHVGAILAELSVKFTAMRAGADMIIRQPAEQRSAGTGTAVIGQTVALPSHLFPAVEEVLANICAADLLSRHC